MINNMLKGAVLCIFDPKAILPFKKVIGGVIIVSKVAPQKKKVFNYSAYVYGEGFKLGIPVSMNVVQFTAIVDGIDKKELLKKFKGCKIIEVNEKLISFIEKQMTDLKQITKESIVEGLKELTYDKSGHAAKTGH